MPIGVVAEFLRARRARISPASAGLRDDLGVRRVTGLRREEVARLAGVSVDYYLRIERGRTRGVSRAVWESVARALQFDEVERMHLLDLVAAETAMSQPGVVSSSRQRADRGLVAVVASMEQVPAMVQGRRMDVLAHNSLFGALYKNFMQLDPRDRNLARFMFLDPAAKVLFADWASAARDVVAMLRLYAGSHPTDPELNALLSELSKGSDLFRQAWTEHRVLRHSSGKKRLVHHAVGRLTLNYQTFQATGDPDQTLVIYHADPGSPSADALKQLGAWSLSDAPTVVDSGARLLP
ncbi:helix-turn-helix transcriptional regulator [Herbiconiux daphne]|uniref:Helix-turn-helix transcriptional regulator n=1 Tax=Herbiconiux daphne TaxID=2970914 RepID=A0ABT2H594_9MICO|nr:helix-turn-helix transcriptional regulator [Herbiconiux daphne]MCS5735068.1 helix-turn-helix transcriptional regulator [Herbiconiux daphne]